MYFVRATVDPHNDIKRGFSGVYNSWVTNYDDIQDELDECYPDGEEGGEGYLPPPHRQDPVTGEWRWDPEAGLSAFAFNDEDSFKEAMNKVFNYGRHLGQIAVFTSDDFDPNHCQAQTPLL